MAERREKSRRTGRGEHQVIWTLVVLIASIAAALVQIRSPRAAQLKTLQRAPTAAVETPPDLAPTPER